MRALSRSKAPRPVLALEAFDQAATSTKVHPYFIKALRKNQGRINTHYKLSRGLICD